MLCVCVSSVCTCLCLLVFLFLCLGGCRCMCMYDYLQRSDHQALVAVNSACGQRQPQISGQGSSKTTRRPSSISARMEVVRCSTTRIGTEPACKFLLTNVSKLQQQPQDHTQDAERVYYQQTKHVQGDTFQHFHQHGRKR